MIPTKNQRLVRIADARLVFLPDGVAAPRVGEILQQVGYLILEDNNDAGARTCVALLHREFSSINPEGMMRTLSEQNSFDSFSNDDRKAILDFITAHGEALGLLPPAAPERFWGARSPAGEIRQQDLVSTAQKAKDIESSVVKTSSLSFIVGPVADRSKETKQLKIDRANWLKRNKFGQMHQNFIFVSISSSTISTSVSRYERLL